VVQRVPLERRSTARIALSLLVTVIIPTVGLTAILCYLIVQFGDTFSDFMSHPFSWL
jgi:hypothetical protein